MSKSLVSPSVDLAAELARREPSEQLKFLIALLDEDDFRLVIASATTIGELQAVDAIPRLIRLLEHDNPRIVHISVKVLGELHAVEAIPQLIEALHHNHPAVVAETALTIGMLHADEAVRRLLQLLEADVPCVIGCAVIALGSLRATTAIPQLIELLDQDDEFILGVVALALADIGATYAIPRLMQLLGDRRSGVVIRATIALGELQATEAIPRLIQLLHHDDISVVESAVTWLGMLKATEALRGLAELLEHENVTVAANAAATIYQLQMFAERKWIRQFLDGVDESTMDLNSGVLRECQSFNAAHRCIPRLVSAFSFTSDPSTREILRSAGQMFPPEYHDILGYLALSLDPREYDRRKNIALALKLPAIQSILANALRERRRHQVDVEQVRASAESEFWLAVTEDPLFRTSADRVADELFPAMRKRLSGIVHKIVCREHSPMQGKKTVNGTQRRVWQNSNSDVATVAGQLADRGTHGVMGDPLAEFYEHLIFALRKGLISKRQYHLITLVFADGCSHNEAAEILGISTKTVTRDIQEIRRALIRFYPNL